MIHCADLRSSVVSFIALLLLASLPTMSVAADSPSAPAVPTAADANVEPLGILFDSLDAQDGLSISINTVGDDDGQTTFSNTACCGIASAQQFIADVRIFADGRALEVTQDASGWTVKHVPRAVLQVRYRLPPSGPMSIDTGVPDQLRPIVRDNLFHVIGTFGLLLPTGRSQSDPLALDIDATRVADPGHSVSSFGSGNHLQGVRATRGEAAKALFLGGAITLSVQTLPEGTVAIAYSGMADDFDASAFSADTVAIIAGERKFFDDSQPWYLVSLHGGIRKNPEINLGGGMGLTHSFVMFSRSDLDSATPLHREQFRWVLAHEYFHNWSGLELRVARQRGSTKDDVSVYWFSEGVTEFYTMRILTRLGLQTPSRSLRILNYKLERYALNSKRRVGAADAARLFWTDPDGEQIPYLRGYLAAWLADHAIRSHSGGVRSLDSALRALVDRASADPGFRVSNPFLMTYLTKDMSAHDGARFRRFVLDGGDVPLGPSSFAPCLVGTHKPGPGPALLQFEPASPSEVACFQH